MNEVKQYVKGFVSGIQEKKKCQLYLQRQGCSTTLNCGHPLFFVEFHEHKGEVVVQLNYSNDAVLYGSRFRSQKVFRNTYKDLAIAKKQVKQKIQQHFDCEVSFSERVVKYCHGMGVTYPYENDDFIVSPLKLSENKLLDTSGNIVINYDGLESLCAKEVISAMSSRISEDCDPLVQRCIRDALRTGFHQCDFKKGAKYCIERLAWLAGCYIQTAEQEQMNYSLCYFLERNMVDEIQ